MVPVVSIVGRSNCGKTTFIEKLIPTLKRRGYRIAVIKHVHRGFEIDRRGKDSWRHRAAGADTVVVAAPDCVAVVKNGPPPSTESLTRFATDVDLIITEGFKQGPWPKIEIVRSARSRKPLCLGDRLLIAVVTDTDIATQTITFGLDDTDSVADFLCERFLPNEPDGLRAN
jgi:molybdopterin-guanine dinucleotide biosynthesis protein B